MFACVCVRVLRALANPPRAALVFTCLCLRCFASGCAQPSSAAQNKVSLFHRHRRTQRGTWRNEEPLHMVRMQRKIHVWMWNISNDRLLWTISVSVLQRHFLTWRGQKRSAGRPWGVCACVFSCQSLHETEKTNWLKLRFLCSLRFTVGSWTL